MNNIIAFNISTPNNVAKLITDYGKSKIENLFL